MLKKRIMCIITFALLTSIFLLFPAISNTSAAPSPDVSFVKVNGNLVSFPDGQPFIKNGRTLVPIRFIAEALNHNVEWDEETQTAIIDNGSILIPIGSNTATVNGNTVHVDVPAELLSDRTYVPLRFISENLNCTVDWFNANKSIIINEKLPDGKEVSLYDRCKQSELFYEKISTYSPEWESYLYYKSSLKDQTDEACSDAEWFICRFFSRYPDKNVRENGDDISLTIKKPTLKTRHEVKDLLMTLYPTGHEEVYDIIMRVAREETFENNGLQPPSISGTFGTRYIDNREIVVNKLFSTDYIAILVKDTGYVNPKKPYIWPDDVLNYKISQGVSRHEAGKWYMETYQLDQW